MTCQLTTNGVACTVENYFWQEPDMGYRCVDCGFTLDADTHSCRFRAENHQRETGHRVGFFLERFEDYPHAPAWWIGEHL